MKLYTISFIHYGPKDSKKGIECYAFAESEQDVMDFIDALFMNEAWGDSLKYLKDDETDPKAKEYFVEVLKYRGEINHPNPNCGDYYYGFTHYGWDEGKPISIDDAQKLEHLGIAHNWLTTIDLNPPHWTDVE